MSTNNNILSQKTLLRFEHLNEQDLDMLFEFLFLLDDLENGEAIKAADQQYLALLREAESSTNIPNQAVVDPLLHNFSHSKS